ncbi:NupC/NupG family nucleoside CNT transporter [Ornithinimicrobium sediminis]|uniref:NupC/NupG family nucleoside CNT transporter n=1 Tax=Ornithinimicrobium sediminis TaxID=2904603 RepID=UPI001E2DF0E9|nr:nucleoside transporter C-terminal domain-containing protein [Ornithinimicrobium sediminis]MCE0486062.1 NupC/NupG family nucleoside CNT transporter [Ornithinimicrobium sediminis]
MNVLWGLGGMAVLLALAVLLSTDRRAIRLRTVGAALALQVSFGVIVLYWPTGQEALRLASEGVQAVINSSNEGIAFLFGQVIPDEGLIFAFQVLPVIIFFASLTAVLYHWGILQRVVSVLGGGIQRVVGTGRAESVNAAANIFVGQTEAPLVIRPYINKLTRSGLFAVMVGGLSTVAGSVLVGYSLLGAPLEYLIAAAFMAAPGALLMAKIVLPETDPDHMDEGTVPATASASATPSSTSSATTASSTGSSEASSGATAASAAPSSTSEVQGRPAEERPDDGHTDEAAETDDDAPDEGLHYRNVIDAAASGASDGLRLALNIGAMLLAFISLIALVNLIIGVVGGWFGYGELTFEAILGWVFAPLMFAIGVPWSEATGATGAGSFVGQKIVVNEFVAFSNFAPMIEEFSPRTAAIITFALTGFANLGSLGILLGGLGGIAPGRRREIAELGIRAVLAATLANLMSAAIAGILIG